MTKWEDTGGHKGRFHHRYQGSIQDFLLGGEQGGGGGDRGVGRLTLEMMILQIS